MRPNPATIVTAGFLMVIAFIIVALFSDPKPKGQPGSATAPVGQANPAPALSPTVSAPTASNRVGTETMNRMELPVQPGRPPVGTMTAPGMAAPPVPNRLPSSAPAMMATPPVANAPLPSLVGHTGADPTLKPFVNPKAKLSEGHWKGLEALPLSLELKKKLKLPIELEGLLIDEVTLNAAEAGLLAGDVIVAVNGNPVRSLEELLAETKKVQMAKSASILVFRRGLMQQFMLVAKSNLGFAQVETAPMILPGEIMPHPYRGPCTQCHAIGTTGHIVPDPDGIILPPPPIRMGMTSPHKDRGPCQACHPIIN
ncbi:MAG: magnetochrome domain-containing protein [Magnetococcales bacterium]|nr:magnetochrome domain-containing protein [Magnetococcales bacterium]